MTKREFIEWKQKMLKYHDYTMRRRSLQPAAFGPGDDGGGDYDDSSTSDFMCSFAKSWDEDTIAAAKAAAEE